MAERKMLQGLRVIDLTRLLPGPLCTMLLGDYGAEVIKVEDLFSGDPTRRVGAPLEGEESGALFWQLNRNKRSICVDLKAPEGKEILCKLAARGDVLVEGFRPGVMERLGLGYEALKKVNSRLVYASLTGYGQEGPYRERAGHDINYAALAGLLDLSGAPGGRPVMPAVQVADIGGGTLMALSGILIALYNRERTGQGCHVDIAMTDGLLPWLAYAAASWSAGEPLPRREAGHITGAYACYNVYETADGKYMSLGALEPVFWQNFCLAVKRPDWVPRQFDGEERESLIKEVQALFRKKTREEWTAFFSEHDACCEPVLEIGEAMEHPHFKARGCPLLVSRPDGASQRQPGFPLRFESRPGEITLPPPRLGEHTMEIMNFLGYTPEEINRLRAQRVIR